MVGDPDCTAHACSCNLIRSPTSSDTRPRHPFYALISTEQLQMRQCGGASCASRGALSAHESSSSAWPLLADSHIVRHDFHGQKWTLPKSPGGQNVWAHNSDEILSLRDKLWRKKEFRGGIAQLVERLVRNEKARGSNPLTSSPESFRGCRAVRRCGDRRRTPLTSIYQCGELRLGKPVFKKGKVRLPSSKSTQS